MSAKDSKKLKMNPWRIVKIFALAFVIFEVIFYLSFQGINGDFFPPDTSFYFYTPALLAASVIFGVISYGQTYYEIEGATFIHSKMGKVVEFTFNNIIYIDQEFSEKKKMMRFFTKDGKEHLLIFDKNAEIYSIALKKCPLISEEEFLRRFPKTKM